MKFQSDCLTIIQHATFLFAFSLSFGSIATTHVGAVPKACPGAESWVAGRKAKAHADKKVTAKDAKLHDTLISMVNEDTDIREALVKSKGTNQSVIQKMESLDARHLNAIRDVAPKGELPRVTEIGSDGMHAVLILVQHANTDHKFQRDVLKLLRSRVASGDVEGQAFALLTDRILTQDNRPQVFGTQMTVKNGAIHLTDIEYPSNLEKRRQEIGLMPFKDYACVMSMSYQMPFTKTTSK